MIKYIEVLSLNLNRNIVFPMNCTGDLHRKFSMSISKATYWPLFCHMQEPTFFLMVISSLTNKAKVESSVKEMNKLLQL